MENKTLIWTNTPKSGLCDRLIDFSLMATYARINKSKFNARWSELSKNYGDLSYYHASDYNPDGITNSIDSSGFHCKFFKDVRYKDYKPENFLNYFELPSHTNIDIDESKLENKWYNDSYIGGIQSPYLFYNNFGINNVISYENFIEEFFKLCSEFKPTKKLIEISKIKVIPNLTIHLRREDKIRLTDIDGVALDYRELSNINVLTENVIDSYLEKNPNDKILFCSDDNDEKIKWGEKYKNNVIIPPIFDYDYEQTYYDIYIMSISDNILLSQRYSGFSMFASFLNKKNFIYLLNDGQITKKRYSDLDNFYYYKDWLKLL